MINAPVSCWLWTKAKSICSSISPVRSPGVVLEDKWPNLDVTPRSPTSPPSLTRNPSAYLLKIEGWDGDVCELNTGLAVGFHHPLSAYKYLSFLNCFSRLFVEK